MISPLICLVILLSFDTFQFLLEVLLELTYLALYWCLRPRKQGSNAISETSRLITAGELPFSEVRGNGQPMCEYPAIAIDEVSLTDLRGGALADKLPKRPIRLPIEESFEIAILSWRWDHDAERRSQNLAAAIKHARAVGIRYLFANIISLDQTLDPRSLTLQILEFSALYKSILVIIAYDEVQKNFDQTLFRPWIYSKIRSFLLSPTKITYVICRHPDK